jgi:HSP20 family molecular chaperone IbpA
MKLSDMSVIDQEFNSIRERFDQEMRKMEDEMSRFRSELMNRESSSFIQKSSTTTTSRMTQKSVQEKSTIDGKEVFNESSSSQEFSSEAKDSGADAPHRSELRTWLDGFHSPLIQEGGADGNKALKLRFDVHQYKPEEIVVKTVDNKLMVHAKHEEKTDNRTVYREYNREFLLPKGTNPEEIRSTLSKDGVLTVEAPLPSPAIGTEKLIPIAPF